MRIAAFIVTSFLLVASAVASACEEHSCEAKGSKEFKKIAQLAGAWEGTSYENGKEEPVTVTYRVTSGGSAVLETLTPGTPHEMVSVYHDEKEKLTMTHYCALKNQPKLALSKASDNAITLTLSPRSGTSPKELHMHEVTITFIDDKTMVQRWKAFKDGKEVHATSFKLARARS